ncbi:NAD(P)/FAD-dependent oxidoreductase [Streptomyces sp. NPDC014995]|uniref:NAD(P)/FAD-dependent oxidoreductase n=1 Tax=Streptomyces sp. NPDC014995 TaxID=3364936 RepID=UPI0037031810
MPTAVIAGGSVAGLAGALALSRIGLNVLVLERAPAPPDGPLDEAIARWERPTVPQAHHSHTLTSLGVRVLRERAPGLLAEARAAGAALLDLTDALPATAGDRTRRPGDEDLVALGCRRACLELLLHRTVQALPGVTVRHDTAVAALELDRRTPRVRAVVTTTGERIPADVVLDATGRRALSRTWLADAGVPLAPDRTSPSALTGYTRFYRLHSPARPGPLNRGNAAGDIFGHYAGVLHPGDHHTFSIALATLPGDPALHPLRTEAGFTAAARATPWLAPWLDDDAGTPISGVRAITSPPNTLRGTAGPGQRPVAGLFPVGDAACVTNPLFGRGMSLALDHVFRLADLLAEQPDITLAQRRSAALMTYDVFTPWYEQAAAADRQRIARWRAAVDGTAPPVPADDVSERVAAASRTDATVWRQVTRMLMSLTPPAESVTGEAFRTRVRLAPAPTDPPPAPPARADLVHRVTAAEEAARTTAAETRLTAAQGSPRKATVEGAPV